MTLAARMLGPTCRTAAPAMVLVGALMVGGCTAEPAPEPEPSPTMEAEPEPSPEPEPEHEPEVEWPEVPAAMANADADGAAAAAEYILGLLTPMMITGDTMEWEARTHRTCEYCKSRLEQAQTIAERGDIQIGGELKATVETVYVRDELTGIWPLDVTLIESATVITDSEGEVLLEAEANTAERRVELGTVDGEWVLVGVADIPEDSR